jgi:hypothetical protein
MQVADALYFSIYLGPCMLLHYRSPSFGDILLGFYFSCRLYLAIVRYPLRHTFPEQRRIQQETVLELPKAGCPCDQQATLYGFISAYTLPPRL